MTNVHMQEYLLYIAAYNSGFRFSVDRWKNRKLLGGWASSGRFGKDSFALHAAILQVSKHSMSPANVGCVGMGLEWASGKQGRYIGDTKQAWT